MKKIECILLGLLVIFVVFSAGFFAGRNTTHSVTVITEKSAPSQSPSQYGTDDTAMESRIQNDASLQRLAVPDIGNDNTALENERININTATVSELCKLPGIGEQRAKAIIDYRNENGPFISVLELLNINGIGESTLDSLKNLVAVSDSPEPVLPDERNKYNADETDITDNSVNSTAASSAADGGKININTADNSELCGLPGIGEKKAQAIIDYRTENGPFECTKDILNVNGIGEGIFEKIKDLIVVE